MLFNGSENLNATDFTLKGQISITLNRWYQSGSYYDSPLGFGWSYAYNVRLYFTAENNAIVREGCGAEHTFVFTGGTWQAPANYDLALINNGGGQYTLQEQDGSQMVFDGYGRLSKDIDVNGNYLKFQYDPAGMFPVYGVSLYGLGSTPTITSYDYHLTEIDQYDASGNPTGRWVKYSYDANGRMSKIADSSGRYVVFTHDQCGSSTCGNLIGVTVYNAQGAIVGDPYVYTYANATDHLITSYSGGVSPVDKGLYTDTYDSMRRVVTQTHGTGLLQFQYTVPSFTTTVYDTITNQSNSFSVPTTYSFNQDGLPLQKIDGLGKKTEISLRRPNNLPAVSVHLLYSGFLKGLFYRTLLGTETGNGVDFCPQKSHE